MMHIENNLDKDAQKRVAEAVIIAALAIFAAEAVRWGWRRFHEKFFPEPKKEKDEKSENKP